MDAVKVSAIDLPTLEMSDPPAQTDFSDIRLARRVTAALAALLDALEYARDLQRSVWDFAVEISALRRLELSGSDLRWLVGKGFVEHAVEVTPSGDPERGFRQSGRLMFCKKTCFVLTPAGAAVAREVCATSKPVGRRDQVALKRSMLSMTAPVEALVPRWDRERQELRIGSILVKRFRVPQPDQETILAAFEEECWPPRIDDPLSPRGDLSPECRLQATIKSLNRNQKRPLIRFLGDGSGIRWEFCADHDQDRGEASATNSGRLSMLGSAHA
jgi:hypothetical protein